MAARRKRNTEHAHAEPAHALRQRLLAYALALPDAAEDHPWGESVAKIAGRCFLFCGREQDAAAGRLTFSVKLPQSRYEAVMLPICAPSGYGMGKHGWVTVQAENAALPEFAMCCAWIDESYHAIAPQPKRGRAGKPAGRVAGKATRKATRKATSKMRKTARKGRAR